MKKILLLYVGLEVIISTFYIQAIGGWFVIQTILSFLFGIFLVKASFTKIITTFKFCRQFDNDLSFLLKENLSIILGAVLLIIPGVLTDILGLLLQIKLTSKLLIAFKGKNTNFQEKTRSNNEEVIIDYNDVTMDCTKS